MSDRELLELAAKAARYSIKYLWIGSDSIISIENGKEWNPLLDDGDALRLAARLTLNIDILLQQTRIDADQYGIHLVEHAPRNHSFDPADTITTVRRAIVRAAAEIGRNMP